MIVFDYLAVIISVIIGLGVTQLLTGFGKLLQSSGRVRFDWIHGAWALLVFLYPIQWWWAIFGLRAIASWDFFSFLLVLLAPVAMYLLAALSFPPPKPDGVDLWDHFLRVRKRFFGIFAALPIVVTLTATLVSDQPLLQAANGLRAVQFGLFVTAARASTRRAHAVLAVLAWLVAIVFVAFIRLRLG